MYQAVIEVHGGRHSDLHSRRAEGKLAASLRAMGISAVVKAKDGKVTLRADDSDKTSKIPDLVQSVMAIVGVRYDFKPLSATPPKPYTHWIINKI